MLRDHLVSLIHSVCPGNGTSNSPRKRRKQPQHKSLRVRELDWTRFKMTVREDSYVNLTTFCQQQHSKYGFVARSNKGKYDPKDLLISLGIATPGEFRNSILSRSCGTVCLCMGQVYVKAEAFSDFVMKFGAVWPMGFLYLGWNLEYHGTIDEYQNKHKKVHVPFNTFSKISFTMRYLQALRLAKRVYTKTGYLDLRNKLVCGMVAMVCYSPVLLSFIFLCMN